MPESEGGVNSRAGLLLLLGVLAGLVAGCCCGSEKPAPDSDYVADVPVGEVLGSWSAGGATASVQMLSGGACNVTPDFAAYLVECDHTGAEAAPSTSSAPAREFNPPSLSSISRQVSRTPGISCEAPKFTRLRQLHPLVRRPASRARSAAVMRAPARPRATSANCSIRAFGRASGCTR